MNPSTGSPTPPWVEAIGWALVRSTWQGAAIAAALALALRSLRRSSPGSRYLAACLALALMIALPVATASRPGPAGANGSAGETRSAVAGVLRGGIGPDPTPSAPRRLSDRLKPALPALVAAWSTCVGLLGLRLLGGWALTLRWAGREARALPEVWLGRLDRLRERMGIRGAVRLLESALVEVPTVIGWLRPAILVPASAISGLGRAELEAILAHELAHIRRHDYLINLVQCGAETLLFYHPAARWASRVIRREREHCSDDLAVAASGDRPALARALATMEGLRRPSPFPSPAANGGDLLPRVRRLLEPREESPMKSARMLLSLALALAVVPAWLPGVSARPTEPPVPAAPSPIRSYADIVANVDEAPTGRLLYEQAALEMGFGTFPRVGDEPKPGPVETAPIAPFPVPAAECPTCLDPPSEAEVWAKIPKADRRPGLDAKVERSNVKMVIEKTGEQVDPAKVYPLAGPCQLVHCHYKATVTFDETYRADYPIPFNHRKARVEVVFIDKDALRRPVDKPAPDAARPVADVDREIDRLGRVVESMKRDRDRDREARRVKAKELEQIRRDLDELERDLKAEPKPASTSAPKPAGADAIRYLQFFVGAFW